MKRFISHITFIQLLLTLSIGCSNKKREYLNRDTFESLIKVNSKVDKKSFFVYYLDGDCALCFAKMKFLQSKMSSSDNLFFLVRSINPVVFKYNFKQTNIHIPYFIDSKNVFEEKLRLNDMLKVAPDKSFTRYEIDGDEIIEK